MVKFLSTLFVWVLVQKGVAVLILFPYRVLSIYSVLRFLAAYFLLLGIEARGMNVEEC